MAMASRRSCVTEGSSINNMCDAKTKARAPLHALRQPSFGDDSEHLHHEIGYTISIMLVKSRVIRQSGGDCNGWLRLGCGGVIALLQIPVDLPMR